MAELTPKTRKEHFLSEIAETLKAGGSGGGGGSEDTTPLCITENGVYDNGRVVVDIDAEVSEFMFYENNDVSSFTTQQTSPYGITIIRDRYFSTAKLFPNYGTDNEAAPMSFDMQDTEGSVRVVRNNGTWKLVRVTKVKKAVIDKYCTELSDDCFDDEELPLQSIKLSRGLTTLGQNVFMSSQIVTVTIPDTVISIGHRALACGTLKEVVMKSTTPVVLGSTIPFLSKSGLPDGFVIKVPYSDDHSVLNAYKTAAKWKTYANYMVEDI